MATVTLKNIRKVYGNGVAAVEDFSLEIACAFLPDCVHLFDPETERNLIP